jgi:hypothetical protein
MKHHLLFESPDADSTRSTKSPRLLDVAGLAHRLVTTYFWDSGGSWWKDVVMPRTFPVTWTQMSALSATQRLAETSTNSHILAATRRTVCINHWDKARRSLRSRTHPGHCPSPRDPYRQTRSGGVLPTWKSTRTQPTRRMRRSVWCSQDRIVSPMCRCALEVSVDRWSSLKRTMLAGHLQRRLVRSIRLLRRSLPVQAPLGNGGCTRRPMSPALQS